MSFASLTYNIYTYIYLSLFFMLLSGGLLIFIIWLKRRTHAFIEFKAYRKGVPICIFFRDDRTVEWLPLESEAGIISHEKYGSFLINSEGTYVDKKMRNVVIPFNTSISVGAPVKLFQVTDALKRVVGDQKELAALREKIMNSELVDSAFDVLRESVNFSSLRGLLNSITPHAISAKINMTLAQRMENYGNANSKQLWQLVIVGLGLIMLAALVLYLTIGNKNPTVVMQAAPIVQQIVNNSSVLAG